MFDLLESEPEAAALLALRREACTPGQLIDRIALAERLITAVQATQLRDVDAFAAARTAADEAAGIGPRLTGRSIAPEVACARGVAPTTARYQVELAQLAVADHPRLLDLLDVGRVSLAGVRAVTEETVPLHPDRRRDVDASLAADLAEQRLTPAQLRAAAARQVIGADPDTAQRRCEAERADRRIGLIDKANGTAAVWAKLKAEEAVDCLDALDAEARAMRAAGDERSFTQLQCDVFVHRLTSRHAPQLPLQLPAADCGPAPATSRALARRARRRRAGFATRRVEVQVVLSAATFLGLDDAPATLRGYGAIPADLARRIADAPDADPVLRRLVCDPIDGRLLAADAATRCYEGTLRRFTLCRDQHSRFPYSTTRIADIDHLVEHSQGGPTTAGNGQGLDKGAHVVRDHPGVRVSALPILTTAQLDDLRANAPTIRWHMPTGHSYDSRPPPALGWGSTFLKPPTIRVAARSGMEVRLRLTNLKHRLNTVPDPPRRN